MPRGGVRAIALDGISIVQTSTIDSKKRRWNVMDVTCILFGNEEPRGEYAARTSTA